MMSVGELVTVFSVTGFVGAVIIACFIYLIRQMINEVKSSAVQKERADINVEVAQKLSKADAIVAERVELSRIAAKLRAGQF